MVFLKYISCGRRRPSYIKSELSLGMILSRKAVIYQMLQTGGMLLGADDF